VTRLVQAGKFFQRFAADGFAVGGSLGDTLRRKIGEAPPGVPQAPIDALRGFNSGSSYRTEVARELGGGFGEVRPIGSNLLVQAVEEIGVELRDLESDACSGRLAGSR